MLNNPRIDLNLILGPLRVGTFFPSMKMALGSSLLTSAEKVVKKYWMILALKSEDSASRTKCSVSRGTSLC